MIRGRSVSGFGGARRWALDKSSSHIPVMTTSPLPCTKTQVVGAFPWIFLFLHPVLVRENHCLGRLVRPVDELRVFLESRIPNELSVWQAAPLPSRTYANQIDLFETSALVISSCIMCSKDKLQKQTVLFDRIATAKKKGP